MMMNVTFMMLCGLAALTQFAEHVLFTEYREHLVQTRLFNWNCKSTYTGLA